MTTSERRISAVHVLSVGAWWTVLLSGRRRGLRRFLRKRSALRFGQEIAGREGVALVVHRTDGTVERTVAPA